VASPMAEGIRHSSKCGAVSRTFFCPSPLACVFVPVSHGDRVVQIANAFVEYVWRLSDAELPPKVHLGLLLCICIIKLNPYFESNIAVVEPVRRGAVVFEIVSICLGAGSYMFPSSTAGELQCLLPAMTSRTALAVCCARCFSRL
jgi:hypothetical protein